MNRKSVLLIGVVAICAAAFLFAVSENGKTPVTRITPEASAEKPSSQAGHQGHETPQNTGAVEEAEGEEPPTVEIDSERQQLIGVKIADVTMRPLKKVVRTVGRIEYDERRIATVNTKIEGWIEKLYVDYTGRYVRKGEPLAEIYSPELIASQQELLNTLKWTKQSADVRNAEISRLLRQDSERLLQAARQRLRLWDLTDEQIAKIEETGSPVRTVTVFSPSAGYVVQKMVLNGMKVMPGEKLFDIADLSTVWVVSDVYEFELPLMRQGLAAAISLSSFPGKEFSAKIDYIYPSLSGDTRTAKVRFVLPNPGNRLKPQMFTDVVITIGLGKKLSVPDDAVLDTGMRQIVYVDRGEGYFEPREVVLGMRAEGYREVVRGLKNGEKVASSATFLIDSEAQLKGVTPLGGHRH